MWKLIVICCGFYVLHTTCLIISDRAPLLWKRRLAYSTGKVCADPILGIRSTCCGGYIENPYNASLCMPYCEGGCPEKTFCLRPNFCACEGKHLRVRDECLPVCPAGDSKCAQGYCLGENCACSVSVRGGVFHCYPVCRNLCLNNQICVDKNTCGCAPRHYLDKAGICRPICRKPCYNGECIAPDKCSCYPNSTLIDGVCQATCWQNCENGTCIRTNVCLCNEDYALKLPELTCAPKCPGCELGRCMGLNSCQCEPGLIYRDNKCQADCLSCEPNGTCRMGGGCDCDDGYEFNSFYQRCCPLGSHNTCLH